jgi:hypothetical protein
MFVGTEHSRVDGKINEDAHVVKAKHSTINLAVVVAAVPVVQAWARMGADVAVFFIHRLFVVNPDLSDPRLCRRIIVRYRSENAAGTGRIRIRPHR